MHAWAEEANSKEHNWKMKCFSFAGKVRKNKSDIFPLDRTKAKRPSAYNTTVFKKSSVDTGFVTVPGLT